MNIKVGGFQYSSKLLQFCMTHKKEVKKTPFDCKSKICLKTVKTTRIPDNIFSSNCVSEDSKAIFPVGSWAMRFILGFLFLPIGILSLCDKTLTIFLDWEVLWNLNPTSCWDGASISNSCLLQWLYSSFCTSKGIKEFC